MNPEDDVIDRPPYADGGFLGLFQQITGTWTVPDDPGATESQTAQQRALPRPSTTPPMWARQPNRDRRNRNR